MKNSLFNTKLEKLNLFLPVVAVMLFLLESFYQFQYSRNSEASLKVLTQIFLFNGFHVIFTFIFLFFGIEFGLYLQDESSKNNNPVKHWLAVFVVFFIFTLVAGLLIFAMKDDLLALKYCTWYLSLYYIFAHQHMVSQNFGVGMIYTQHFSKSLNVRFKSTIYTLEKTLKIHVMIAVITLSILVSIGSYSLRPTVIFFEISLLLHLTRLLFLYKKASRIIFEHKVVFCLRYLLFPLSFISPIALIGLASVHGSESMMFSEKIFRKGRFKFNRAYTLIAVFCVIHALCILFSTNGGILGFFLDQYPRESTWYIVPFTILHATSLTHFYVEGFIYKLSNKSVLNNQGQLILS